MNYNELGRLQEGINEVMVPLAKKFSFERTWEVTDFVTARVKELMNEDPLIDSQKMDVVILEAVDCAKKAGISGVDLEIKKLASLLREKAILVQADAA